MNRRDFLKAAGMAGIAAATASYSFEAFNNHPEACEVWDAPGDWKRYVFHYDKLPAQLKIERGSVATFFDTEGILRQTDRPRNFTFSYYAREGSGDHAPDGTKSDLDIWGIGLEHERGGTNYFPNSQHPINT